MSFDVRDEGVTELQKELDALATGFPKEARQVLRRVGSRARTIIARKGRQLVKKETGNYHKGFKRGRVWVKDGSYRVRVYNNQPHAHLIEDGRRIIGKDGSEHGFKKGYKVIDKGTREFEKEMDEKFEKEIDRILDKL